jgi:hypothetical protein
VAGIDRQHDMDQLMRENAEHFDRIGDIGSDDNLEISILGRGAMPRFADAVSIPSGWRKGDRETDVFGNFEVARREVGPKLAGRRS